MIDRQSVMAYSTMGSVFSALAAGFSFDINIVGVGSAFIMISIASVIMLIVAYADRRRS